MAPDALKCRYCQRTFSRGEHLRRHLRTHTKEKPFRCHCGKSFTRRDLLKRHKSIYHSSTPGDAPPASSDSPELSHTLDSALNTPTGVNLSHDNVSGTPTPAGSGGPLVAPVASSVGGIPAPDNSLFAPGNWAANEPPQPGLLGISDSDFFDIVGTGFDFGFNSLDPSILDSGTALQAPIEPGPAGQRSAGHPVGPSPFSAGDVHASRENAHERIPNTQTGEDDFHELRPVSRAWPVTEAQRSQFAKSLEPYRQALGEFVLPSRLSMTRYLAGFADGFGHHHPAVHMATFAVSGSPHTPEFVLALMAVGAQYRYEMRRGTALYQAGRAIILHRLRAGELGTTTAPEPGVSFRELSDTRQKATARMDTTRAVLLLCTFATWSRDQKLVRESFDYQTLLAGCVRDGGLTEHHSDDGDDWYEWARIESDRRTKLATYCLLNMQTLLFNLPPVLVSTDINLRLPSSNKEWVARGPAEWRQARTEAVDTVNFQYAFAAMLRGDSGPIGVTSPFGDLVLIHALLQRLFFTRQLSVESHANKLAAHDTQALELSLNRWRDQWLRTPESVLDVRNSRSSLSWASTSLLGLAHVRLHFHVWINQLFYSGTPEDVAAAAINAQPPERGPHLLHALLHAVHALNVPMQMGIDYVANCQAFFWSLQHSFSAFEIAIFLSKWLSTLSETQGAIPLDKLESQIVEWLMYIVREAPACLDNVGGMDLPAKEASRPGSDAPDAVCLERLGVIVVELFAHMFENCNTVWPIMRAIGQSLRQYAILLGQRKSGDGRVGRAPEVDDSVVGQSPTSRLQVSNG